MEKRTYGIVTHSLEPLTGAVEEAVEVPLVLDIVVLAAKIRQTVSLQNIIAFNIGCLKRKGRAHAPECYNRVPERILARATPCGCTSQRP